MSSVPNQLQELRDEMARIIERIAKLERENAAWRDAFSRGCMPPPRPVVN